MKQGNFDFWDLISLWSLDIGMQNLALNEKQVKALMGEMTDNQDALLLKIISQNECIIQLLEELKCGKSKS